MGRLIIHIGTHKTGSTAIQHLLENNKVKLKKCKYQVLTGKDGDFSSDIEKMLKKDGNYIISYEGLAGDMHSSYSKVDEKLAPFTVLSSHYDITLIAYYREQIEFLEAIYCQYIHEGGSKSFEEYFSDYDIEGLDYTHHINKIIKALPTANLKASIYNSKHLLVDFIEHSGLSILEIVDAGPRVNVSYNIKAIEFAKFLNPNLNPAEKKALRHSLQILENKSHGPSFHMPLDLASKLREKFADSNTRFSKQLNIPVFDYKPLSAKVGNYEVNDKDFTKILAKIIIHEKANQVNSRFINFVVLFESKLKIYIKSLISLITK